MLRGAKVVLRGIERADVETLAVWDTDYETWPQISYSPYAPRSVEDILKEYDEGEESPYRADEKSVPFAIDVEGTLVGAASLWGIDVHNRRAHLGIGLGPEHWGKGYGSDACRVLLRYAFVDRGFHRVQLETLANNERALQAYRAVGFVEEGRTRESAWITGQFVDEVFMSVLATDVGALPAE